MMSLFFFLLLYFSALPVAGVQGWLDWMDGVGELLVWFLFFWLFSSLFYMNDERVMKKNSNEHQLCLVFFYFLLFLFGHGLFFPSFMMRCLPLSGFCWVVVGHMAF